MIDYSSIAKKHGGSQSTQSGATDYSSLAGKYGAINVQAQPKKEPTPFTYDVGTLTPEEQQVETQRKINRARETEKRVNTANETFNYTTGPVQLKGTPTITPSKFKDTPTFAQTAEFTKNVASGLPIIGAPIRQGVASGQALASKDVRERLLKTKQIEDEVKQNLIQKIRENEANGIDNRKLKLAYNNLIKSGIKFEDQVNEIVPGANQATGEAVGNVAEMGIDILTAGTYGAAKKGILETGKLLSKQTVKEVGLGGATGYAYDVASNLQQDKENTFTPGVGTAVGILTPLGIRGTESAVKFFKDSTPKNTAINQFNKALGITGKKTPGGIIHLPEQRFTAAKTLYDNAPNVKVVDDFGIEKSFDPKKANFSETVQAHQQTKQQLYDEVQKRLRDAGEQGIQVNNAPAIAYLDDIIRSKSSLPQTKATATSLRQVLAEITDPTDLQRFLSSEINPTLGAVFTGSDRITGKINANIARLSNEALDTALAANGNPAIRDLQQKYSSLLSIDTDLANQAKKILANRNDKFGEVADIFASGDVLLGALSSNPAMIGKGVGQFAVKAALKELKSPERALRKAFAAVEKYNKKLTVQNPIGPEFQLGKGATPLGAPKPSTSFTQRGEYPTREPLGPEFQLGAGNKNMVQGETVRLPSSAYETNRGISEVKEARIVNPSDRRTLLQKGSNYGLENFTDKNKTPLKTRQFVIVSAENPNAQKLTPEENAKKSEPIKLETVLYRGGKNKGSSFSTSKNIAEDFAKNRGGNVGEYTLSKDAKIAEYSDFPSAIYKGIDDYNVETYAAGEKVNSFMEGKLEQDYTKATKWAKDNGYDAIRFPTEGEVRVINESAVQEKGSKKYVFEKNKSKGKGLGTNKK